MSASFLIVTSPSITGAEQRVSLLSISTLHHSCTNRPVCLSVDLAAVPDLHHLNETGGEVLPLLHSLEFAHPRMLNRDPSL